MTRRELLALLAAGGVAPFWLPRVEATAQPGCARGRRIRWLVGWSPGGGYDAYARMVEPFLERALGAEVVIDNQAGAGGRVAAVVLSRTRPDGRTIGILDGPGVLWAAASGERDAPDLERDFTLLARIARPVTVLSASVRSGIRNVADLLAAGRQRTLVVGSTAPGSQNFVTAAVMMAAFGVECEFVVGYPGSREVLMGLVRGDFDLTAAAAETAIDQIRSGDAVPIATVVRDPDLPGFDRVPSLDGPNGIVREQPGLFPDPDRAGILADALSRYLGAGRLIAAPPKLPDDLRRCLDSGLRTVLNGRELQASARRAGRTLSVAFDEELLRGVRDARQVVARVVRVADDARRRVR